MPAHVISKMPVAAVFEGDGYENAILFYADALSAEYNYWNFEDGNQRQGPFIDGGDHSVAPTLTSNNTRLTVGGMYCGPRGAPPVSGVIHGNRSALTTPGWIGSSGDGSIPAFGATASINAFMRRGFTLEKGLLWFRVANTGETVEYETALEILSSGVLRLRIETPDGNVQVDSDAAVWPDADRNNWKMVTVRQDGSGIDFLVDGSTVAVTRTYTGTAGATTWINDMLAYASRDTAQDRFRVLDRGQTESDLDAYNHVGVGGLAILHAPLTDAQAADLYDAANVDGTPLDVFEVVAKICADNGDDWPLFWAFAGDHMGVSSDSGHTGLNLARPANEDNGYKAQAIQRGIASSKYSVRYRAAMTGFGNSTFDSIQAESANGNSNWESFDHSEGMIIIIGTWPTILSGVNHTALMWGRASSGTSRNSYIDVRVGEFSRTGQPRGNFAVALAERGQTTTAPRDLRWFWDDADIQDGELFAVVIRKQSGLNDAECWINGTKQSLPPGEPFDNSTFYDRASWFDDVEFAADAQGGVDEFQMGSAISTSSSVGGWQGGTIEHVIIDDDAWSDAQITEFFDALDDAESYVPSGDLVTVTIGNVTSGPTVIESGFEDGSHGSVSGSPSFSTGSVRELQWRRNAGDNEFIFDCDGIVDQDSFKYLVMETNYGFFRLYPSRATFTQGGGRSRWVWEANNSHWQDLSPSDTERVWFVLP